jgi:hypothetical protein
LFVTPRLGRATAFDRARRRCADARGEENVHGNSDDALQRAREGKA